MTLHLLNILLTSTITSYIVWVLLGCVAWISHLGHRLPSLQQFLPAQGYPSNAPPAQTVLSFLTSNVPLSLLFVLPHSFLVPSRMRKIVGKQHGRLLYNFMAALTLHGLLYNFTPLNTPVVMTFPLDTRCHDFLSVGCLCYAAFAFLKSPQTMGLLGVADALHLTDQRYQTPSGRMDAITWMGVTTWRLGATINCGAFAFVLFSGISIIPRELTLGDCITRLVAAVYLRRRSRSFRKWVDQIEHIHLLTWALRALLLSAACYGVLTQTGDVKAVAWVLVGAVSLAGVLRTVERHHNV